MTNYKYAAG